MTNSVKTVHKLIGLLVFCLSFVKQADAVVIPQVPPASDFLPYFCVRGFRGDAGFGDPSALAMDARSGMTFVADTATGVVDAFNFQGSPRFQFGLKDGLKAPLGVAVDSHNNVFVSENEGGPVKIIDSSGAVTVLDISAAKGEEAAKPGRMTVDRDGNLYVVERASQHILVFDKNRNLKFSIGSFGDRQGQFKMLQAVAVDRQGRIYALDSSSPSPVQVFDRKGNFIYRFGTVGEGDQDVSFPSGLFIDRHDQVWIVDKTAHALKVFDRAGVFLRKFGTYGLGVGELFYPIDGAIDDLGRVYVLESGTRRLQVFTLKRPFDPFSR